MDSHLGALMKLRFKSWVLENSVSYWWEIKVSWDGLLFCELAGEWHEKVQEEVKTSVRHTWSYQVVIQGFAFGSNEQKRSINCAQKQFSPVVHHPSWWAWSFVCADSMSVLPWTTTYTAEGQRSSSLFDYREQRGAETSEKAWFSLCAPTARDNCLVFWK